MSLKSIFFARAYLNELFLNITGIQVILSIALNITKFEHSGLHEGREKLRGCFCHHMFHGLEKYEKPNRTNSNHF